jgi:hypothetical protein
MIFTALALLAATGATPAAKPTPAKTAPAKAPSAAQTAARARMTQCSKQYQADKAAKKLAAGQTWPKYYSACNAKMKG